MPTYHEAMTTDLSTLTSAAEKWDDMAGEFKKVEEAYKRDVHKISTGETWRGLAATAANSRFDATLREYQAAQKEAKAVAAVLREAHTQFTDLRTRLKSVVADAVTAGMKVSERGDVAYDYDRLTAKEREAARHDPDFASTVRTRQGEWQQAVTGAVKAFTDADEGVKIALEAVVVDSNPLDGIGFNGSADASKDIEEYEADRAADIATRINSGESVSAADRAELQRAFRDNAGNKEFNQTFLNRIGADGAIQLANKLNDGAHGSDKKLRSQYQDLQKGLANTIAHATQVPKSVAQLPPGSKAFEEWKKSDDGKFYRDFTAELEKTGTKNYGSNTNPLYGYQSLVSTMSHADVTFDDQFLYELGDDMIRAEDERKGIFTQVGGGREGIRSDALDELLSIMSKNPDAATAFFDSAVKGGGEVKGGAEHLHYLAGTGDGSRDWPKILFATGTDMDDPSSRTGLALALETATTGRPPLAEGQDPWPDMPHTDAQARVMSGVVRELSGYEASGESVPENLRKPVARSLAQYTDDTHEILSGTNARYIEAVGNGGFFREGDDSHMAVNQKELVQAMRGLSEDPEAYGTLHKAESRHIDEQMARIPEGASSEERNAPLGKAGAALGMYTAIREDVINDERMAGYSEADWKTKIAYHVVGGAVTPMAIPTAGGSIVVGDALQRLVDTWAWTWGNEMKAEADDKADAEIADKYLNATNQMTLMTTEWAEGRKDIDSESDKGKAQIDSLIRDMHDGHDWGSRTADKYI